MKLDKDFRLIREKDLNRISPGESITIKKIDEPEFILRAAREISLLYREGVSQSSVDKFVDILCILETACEKSGVSWLDVSKQRYSTRYEFGKFGRFIGKIESSSRSEG